VADREAKENGLLRVIDASGDGYLYPETIFELVRTPRTKAAVLLLRQ
jgi:hypothetical protein